MPDETGGPYPAEDPAANVLDDGGIHRPASMAGNPSDGRTAALTIGVRAARLSRVRPY